VQGAAGGALCVSASAFPAMVNEPLREDVPLLAVTEYVTVPFPDPLAPDVIEAQLRLSVAVQAHPLPAVTATVAEPPPAAIDCDVGEIENVQGAGADPVHENEFELALRPIPPGPTAATFAV
jgi:hypothetical protein